MTRTSYSRFLADQPLALAVVPGDDLWSGTILATLNFGWPERNTAP